MTTTNDEPERPATTGEEPVAPASTPTAAPEQPGRPRRRGRLRLWLALAGLVLLAGMLVGGFFGLHWAAGDPRGTAWILARLAQSGIGIVVTEPEGSLLGDFKAKKVDIRIGVTRVEIESPRWSGLGLTYSRLPGTWAVLHARSLHADRTVVSVAPSPPSGKPATLPGRIVLPLEILVEDTSVDELIVPGLQDHPFRQVRTRVHLGAGRGDQHRFDEVTGRFENLSLSGHARIGAKAPMALDVQVQAVQADESATAPTTRIAGAPLPPAWARALRQGWQARLDASGPLARFDVRASLKSKGQQLDAHAQVEPIAPWPLPQLEASTQGLDLSALLPDAPATALGGTVSITSLDGAQGASGGFKLLSELTNARPGAWSEHQLPVRSAKVDLRGRPSAAGPLDLDAFEVVLADTQNDAGTLRGSGHWDARQFNLKAALAQVKPGALDARLPTVTLSGPVSLSGQFPAPPEAGASAARPTFKALADLSGRMTAPDRAVELKLDASGSQNRIELREFRAVTGGARATLAGTAERAAAAWQLKAHAALVEFDPRPWLPWTGNTAWAAGPHRLNLQSEVALNLPDKAAGDTRGSSLVDRLATLRGDASVRINPSVLAGEPLSGQLDLRHAAATEPLRASGQLDLGGNTVKLEGTVAPDTRHPQDRWTLETRAPALARLAPVLRMLPAAQASGLLEGLNGAFTAEAQATGRWPELAVQGKATLANLKAGPLTATQGDLRWQLGTTAQSPLDVQADIAQLGWGPQQFGGTRLQLKGSAQSHELSLRTEMKAAPPPWMDNLQGRAATAAPGSSRTQAVLTAQGSLSGGPFDAASPSGDDTAPFAWKGTVQQLEVRSTQPNTAPWIATRNVGLELQGGASPRFVMSAGRADILTAGLRWDRIEWQPGEGVRTQALDMQAELEPLAVAPLLNRLQPDFGWNGDLKIGGKVVIKQAAEFSADIVLERVGGDLNVTDDSGTQALGLTDLVLSITAQNGLWSFTQGMAGKQLGVAAGSFVARTSPQLAWPDANAPLQGVFEAKVENLGTWGAWVPAGWRLGGQLRTTASLAGRFGAPEYTGHVEGSGITVRNLLQGVNVAEGEVDITLQGDIARINRFSARAGAGTVKLSGDAQLGAAPRAQLQLEADKFQLLGRVDRRIVASGAGQVTLDRENLKIDGRFGVDEGLFDFTRADAPTLGSDVVVSGRSNGNPEPAPASASATPATERTRNTAINLQVDLGKNLRLRGRGIDTGLQGEMKITTPGGVPSWNGVIRAVGGTYAAYGQKLDIERGVITFYGPVADPRLDIHATRPNLDVEVGVAISGTAQNPRVRLYSEPDMSDIDKLSWLMLGRASEGLGTSDTALLQRAALALLAGDNPSVTDQVLHSIGIDDVSVRQSDGEVRDTVVSLGKQLSRRWYVGYERGLNATAGTWQLIYRIAQRFTLRAQSGLDNSLDVIWTWRWE